MLWASPARLQLYHDLMTRLKAFFFLALLELCVGIIFDQNDQNLPRRELVCRNLNPGTPKIYKVKNHLFTFLSPENHQDLMKKLKLFICFRVFPYPSPWPSPPEDANPVVIPSIFEGKPPSWEYFNAPRFFWFSRIQANRNQTGLFPGWELKCYVLGGSD